MGVTHTSYIGTFLVLKWEWVVGGWCRLVNHHVTIGWWVVRLVRVVWYRMVYSSNGVIQEPGCSYG